MVAAMFPNVGPETLKPPLKLFWMSDFRTELDRIDAAMPAAEPKPPRNETQWATIMDNLIALLEDGTGSPSFQRLSDLPPAEAAAVRWQKDRVVRTMGSAGQIAGDEFPRSHIVLLPQRVRARYRHVFACSDLPIAWVQSLDVARHGAGRKRPPAADPDS